MQSLHNFFWLSKLKTLKLRGGLERLLSFKTFFYLQLLCWCLLRPWSRHVLDNPLSSYRRHLCLSFCSGWVEVLLVPHFSSSHFSPLSRHPGYPKTRFRIAKYKLLLVSNGCKMQRNFAVNCKTRWFNLQQEAVFPFLLLRRYRIPEENNLSESWECDEFGVVDRFSTREGG